MICYFLSFRDIYNSLKKFKELAEKFRVFRSSNGNGKLRETCILISRNKIPEFSENGL